MKGKEFQLANLPTSIAAPAANVSSPSPESSAFAATPSNTVRVSGQHEYHLVECPTVYDPELRHYLRSEICGPLDPTAKSSAPTKLESLLESLKAQGKRVLKIRHIAHANCWEVKVSRVYRGGRDAF